MHLQQSARLRLLILIFSLIGSLAPALRPVHAQTTANPNPVQTPSLDDRAGLEAFVDGLMAAHLDQFNVPGAVVAIVHEGEIALAKGYGYADLETLTPVQADVTLFRLGSITKLFTWTAAMQLVEAGQLDLHADINTYLINTPVRVPDTYLAPVTMAHLMAHTPGFEDRSFGLFAHEEASLAPLETLLTELPTRVYPPGEQAAYSNYGSALAALVIQEISGEPWADYVENHILEPLGMARTTVRQPVPEPLAADLATGYSYGGGRHQAEGFEFVPLAPAGSASATATDMARFMLAHLQYGEFEGRRILDEATARQMQTQHFTHSDFLPGMAHGFIEAGNGSNRWFGHGADTMWFHNGLLISTAHNAGIFVGYNGQQGSAGRIAFLDALRERYFFDQEDILPTPPTITAQQLAHYTGDYRTNRMAFTTPDKVGGLFMTMNVMADADGYLVLSGLTPAPVRYTEIGPARFRALNANGTLGREEIVFGLDPQTTRPTMLYHSAMPMMAFVRLSLWDRPLFHGLLLLGAVVVFLGALIAWPVQMWRAHRRTPARRQPRWSRVAKWLGWATALVMLVYLIGTITAFSDPMQAVFGVPPIFDVIGWLPLLTVIPVLAMWVLAVVAWQKGYWKRGGRIFYTLVVVFATAHLWQLWYWNLLLAPLIM